MRTSRQCTDLLDVPQIAASTCRPPHDDRPAICTYDYDRQPPPYPAHQASAELERIASFAFTATGGGELRRNHDYDDCHHLPSLLSDWPRGNTTHQRCPVRSIDPTSPQRRSRRPPPSPGRFNYDRRHDFASPRSSRRRTSRAIRPHHAGASALLRHYDALSDRFVAPNNPATTRTLTYEIVGGHYTVTTASDYTNRTWVSDRKVGYVGCGANTLQQRIQSEHPEAYIPNMPLNDNPEMDPVYRAELSRLGLGLNDVALTTEIAAKLDMAYQAAIADSVRQSGYDRIFVQFNTSDFINGAERDGRTYWDPAAGQWRVNETGLRGGRTFDITPQPPPAR